MLLPARFRRPAIAASAIALSLVPLAACGSTESTKPTAAAASHVAYPADSPCPPLAKTAKITLPLISPSSSASWLYYGLAKGIFKQCGIDVTVTAAQTSAQVSSYLSGDLPIAATGGGLPAVVAATKRPISVLGMLGKSAVFDLMGHSEVHGPDDLRGKVIGVNSNADSTYKVALFYLKKIGVRPNQVTFKFLDNVANVGTALRSGSIDFGVSTTPLSQILEGEGLVHVVDFSKEDIALPQQPIVAQPDWVADHPNVAANLIRAIVASIYQIKQNPEVTAPMLVKELKLDDSTAAGKKVVDGAVAAAYASYQSPEKILTVDKETVDLFLSTAPDDIAARLEGYDMTKLLPAVDIGAELRKDGFLDHLTELYGPLSDDAS